MCLKKEGKDPKEFINIISLFSLIKSSLLNICELNLFLSHNFFIYSTLLIWRGAIIVTICPIFFLVQYAF